MSGCRKSVIETYECTVCKQLMFVPRKTDRKRGRLHLKTLWCPYCERKTIFENQGS